MSFQSHGVVGKSIVITVTGVWDDGQPHPLPSPVTFAADPAASVTFAPHADGVSTVATFTAPGDVTFTCTEVAGDKTFTDSGTATVTAPPPPALTSIVASAAPG